ncbi:MAG: hypothetical protein R3326_07825, partial [Gemmatimonadota bacterium]|nr:hypothetical protein [Gemmatimonadota bacterium]
TTTQVTVGADGAVRYRIVYRGPEGSCFEIAGEPAEGFGGPVPPNERRVVIDALPPGEGVRLYWSDGADPSGAFPEATVFTDWIPAGDLAHRFASPASPVGVCPAVDPDVAEEIVASLALVDGPAGVEAAGAGELRDRDVRPPKAGDPAAAFDDHAWHWMAYNDPTIEASASESPDRVALRLLEELGMGVEPGEPGGEHPVEVSVEVRQFVDGPAAVRITRAGGGDDSVAAVRYLVLLEELEEGLLEFRVGRAFRCHPGRGHEEWSPELCL